MKTGEPCDRCGLCLDVCIVFQQTRSSAAGCIQRMSAAGFWDCLNCWKCLEACPRALDLYELMMAQRRKQGRPALIERLVQNITRTGVATPCGGIDAIRAMHGLEPSKLIAPDRLAALLSFQEAGRTAGARIMQKGH